jgi:adenine-specific DNA-methyltransferase
MMDEIFGINNYLGLISRKQSSGSKNDTGNNKVITTADYILPYKKNNFTFRPYQLKSNKKFNLKDEIGFYSTRALEMQGGGDTLPQRSKMGYSIYFNKSINKVEILFDYDLDSHPVYKSEDSSLISKGYKCYRPRKRGNELGIWRWGAETFIERFNNNLVHFENDKVYIKERETDFFDKYPEALLEDYLNTQGTNELKAIFDVKTFDFPKPSELLKFLFSVSTNKNAIVLDSFAGSGTTAHAVLNLNKQDGGTRKFILIEREDYADKITAERVKRVIKGYANIEGTGGGFDYLTLGETLFDEDNSLNMVINEDAIKEYIWYSETRMPFFMGSESSTFLGIHNNTGYYFIYEKESSTTLDYHILAENIKHKAERYIIYADNCLLSETFMKEKNIEFKKNPRDITRF